MLDKMIKIGKRWQKNGMDRIYINLSTIGKDLVNEIPVENYFNRFEKNNCKIFFDVIKEELVITHGNDEAKEAVRTAINNRIKED